MKIFELVIYFLYRLIHINLYKMQQLLESKFSYKPIVSKIDPKKFWKYWRDQLHNSTVTGKVTISQTSYIILFQSFGRLVPTCYDIHNQYT